MKFDLAKVWPHPVLRPPSYGNDYPDAEFEVDIDVSLTKDGTTVKTDVVFRLSEPDMSSLIEQGSADYVLLVKASRTQFREAIAAKGQSKICRVFRAGTLSGRVSLSPFVICREGLTSFRSNSWHDDFGDRTYCIPPGAVLAEDVPKDYWVDTADERPLGSIFGHKDRADIENGYWKVELGRKRIWIVMSPGDSARYCDARDKINETTRAQYLMSGLYLPALMDVLKTVDDDVAHFQDFRWFASLNKRLEDVGCSALGSKDADRLVDAQKVLEAPMFKMPLFQDASRE